MTPLSLSFSAAAASSSQVVGASAASLLEEGLVVEERPGGGDERQPVLGALGLSGGGERREEVGLDGDGEDLVGGVELTGGRVVGVGADLRDVGGLVGLDHLGDLAVDVVPGLDLDLDLHAGVIRLEGGDEVGPVLLGRVPAGQVVVGGDQSEGHVTGFAPRTPHPATVAVSPRAAAAAVSPRNRRRSTASSTFLLVVELR